MTNYIIITILLLIIEILYLKVAAKKNIKDNPNSRSAHTNPTIRGGGIIFIFSIILYALFFEKFPLFYYYLFAVSLVAVISFIDDLIMLSSKLRIVFHLVAFSTVFYALELFNFSGYITLILLVISYIFSIGFLNIYNFMDGINGITFLNALVTLSGLWYINEYQLSFIDSQLLITIMIGVVVFGFFNFRKKALCFAGDIGSITIGFSLIFFILKLYLVTNNILILLLLSVYLLDGGWTIFERIVRRENIFEAHKRHLYQILVNDFKHSHLKISSIYFMVQLIVNFCLFYYLDIEGNQSVLFLIIFSILSIVYVSIKMYYLKGLKLLKNG